MPNRYQVPLGLLRCLSRVARACAATFVLVLLLAPRVAWAGDVAFGQGHDSLDVDDDGQLTAAGRKAVVKAIDRTPGEDQWETQLWAQVDRGAEGPIYVEFYQKVDGKEYIVQRYDDDEYDGSRYFTMNLVLDGNVGFNKDRSYRVVVVQVDEKGKDLKVAQGSIKLIDTGREPEPDDEEEEDEEPEDDGEADDLDNTPTQAEPPPVAPSSKGCRVAPTMTGQSNATTTLSMLLVGVILGRRRRA